MIASVYSDRTCCGFVIARGREGFEAYDRDERSIGFFPTNVAAADAVLRSAQDVEAQSGQDR
jgi:hypothetical protein